MDFTKEFKLPDSKEEISAFFTLSPEFKILNTSLSPSFPYLPRRVELFSRAGVSISEKPKFLKFFLKIFII